MKLQHLIYSAEAGWDRAFPVDMDSSRTLVLAFGAPQFGAEHAPFAQLAQAFPKSVMVGCSTAGEISGSQVHDASISVAIAHFEHSELRYASTAVANAADSFQAGARLAPQLAKGDLRSVFVLSEGVHVNGSALVDGLACHLPSGVTITGGLAGDGSRFQSTWVLEGREPKQNRVCAVGFYGQRMRVGHGCDGGWQDFGPERRMTRTAGNVLYELDGKPALDLYKTYLGDRAQGLPGTALLFPLAVRRNGKGHDTLVRTVLGIDEAQHSLTFAGDLPQGGIARLMRANSDQLIDSASQAGKQAAVSAGGNAETLMISVSCVGRRLVLGERTDEEVEAVSDSAPDDAVHVGFYSYGEIAPAAAGGISELHNQTMTVTVLREV